MKSRITRNFRILLKQLPQHVQRQAKKAFSLFSTNPWHPSLQFKQVHDQLPIYSVRISKEYRALGEVGEDGILWYWVGSHEEYNKLLS